MNMSTNMSVKKTGWGPTFRYTDTSAENNKKAGMSVKMSLVQCDISDESNHEIKSY